MKITIETTTWNPKGSRDIEKERECYKAFLMIIWVIPFIIIKKMFWDFWGVDKK